MRSEATARRWLADPEDPRARAAAEAEARRGLGTEAAAEARCRARALERHRARIAGEQSGRDDPILPCCEALGAEAWAALGRAHRMTLKHCAALERRLEGRD